MRRISVFILSTIFIVIACMNVLAGRGDDKAGAAARAQELLGQARAALGGEAKLKAVQSLTASGKLRQVMQNNDADSQTEGEIEMNVLLPDKYMRAETMPLPVGDGEVKRISGINGEQIFRDAQSTGPGMVMIRPMPDDPKARAGQVRMMREEFARNVIAWLLTSPPNFPVEFSYAGEAESKDGKADALDIKGPEGFNARLFLDKQTHLPLMLSYRAPQPRVTMITRTAQGSHEDLEARKKEAQEQAEKQAANPQLSEVQVYFSEYRAEEGILLPHRVTRSVNGDFSEEWELKKFKINPPLKAESFKK
ncbi:MAG TPA: hypothetical protein VJZ26_16350 [Blastocatellia bacterium]|nr:hypothetical protein [Blastocatellia bacterium]